MKEKSTDYQPAPPGMHIHNTADSSIIDFKYHFIAVLCVTDPDFLMKNWDRLLEQAEITLNLLHLARLNPRLLVYEQLNGEFDFNIIPMAPPGARNLVHDKPHNRCTWSPHVQKVW